MRSENDITSANVASILTQLKNDTGKDWGSNWNDAALKDLAKKVSINLPVTP